MNNLSEASNLAETDEQTDTNEKSKLYNHDFLRSENSQVEKSEAAIATIRRRLRLRANVSMK